jgi:hypothetical protein
VQALVVRRPGEAVDPQLLHPAPGLHHVGVVALLRPGQAGDPDVLDLQGGQGCRDVDAVALSAVDVVDEHALDVDGARGVREVEGPVFRGVPRGRLLAGRDVAADEDDVVAPPDERVALAGGREGQDVVLGRVEHGRGHAAIERDGLRVVQHRGRPGERRPARPGRRRAGRRRGRGLRGRAGTARGEHGGGGEHARRHAEEARPRTRRRCPATRDLREAAPEGARVARWGTRSGSHDLPCLVSGRAGRGLRGAVTGRDPRPVPAAAGRSS